MRGIRRRAVFPVKIARDAKVTALQEAIFDNQRYRERFSFPPRSMTLCLARKEGGTWLTGGQNVKDQLSEAVDTDYPEMLSSWKLDKEEYFGSDFHPGEEEIHVLVELPDAAVGVGNETSLLQIAKVIREMRDQFMQSKRKKYARSQVNSVNGSELLQDLNIQVEAVRTISFAIGESTPAENLKWESIKNESGQRIKLFEEQQCELYRAYAEDNIGDVLSEKKLCVLGVEKDNNILSIKKSTGHEDIELVGRTDFLILSDLVKENKDDLQFLPGVKMLIVSRGERKRHLPGAVGIDRFGYSCHRSSDE